MRITTTTALLLTVALFSAGCSKDEPSISQLPDVDAETVAENVANAQKRGWVKLEPLTLADVADKK